jgi:hypothetical protein
MSISTARNEDGSIDICTSADEFVTIKASELSWLIAVLLAADEYNACRGIGKA